MKLGRRAMGFFLAPAIVLAAFVTQVLPACQGNTCGTYSDEQSENLYVPQVPQGRYDLPEADPTVDYNKIGIGFAKSGDLVNANKQFVMASLKWPYRGDVWANIGLSLRDLAEQGRSPGTPIDDMRQAIAGFDIGLLLGNTPSENMRKSALDAFRQRFPNRCPATNCDRWKAEQKALKLMKELRHIDAVNHLCAPIDRLTVHLTPTELRRGIIAPETMRSLLYTMRICGVVSMADVFSKETLESIHSAQKPLFSEFYEKRPGKSDVAQQEDSVAEYVNAADRGPKRYEVKFPLQEPFTKPEFFSNRFVLMLAKAMLDDHIEIDTFSSVTSLPDAGMQNWHSDVGHLFERIIVDEKQHIPAQGVVVVAPLVDLNAKTGPTEFMTGSHVGMGIDFWHNHDNDYTTPVHKIPATVGSVVMFDLRTRHRGTPNKSDVRRPITYLSYVREWYSDKVNFKDKQTRRFDSLGSMMAKKLFMRLDTLDYTSQLEDIISKETDIDLTELQSHGGYKKIDLHV